MSERMNTIKIKCPNCGAILLVQDNPSNQGKSVRCPACKDRHKFIEFKLIKPVFEEDKTCIGQSLPNEDRTRLPNMPVSTIGYLVNETDNQKYSLVEGVNLIGRKTYQQAPLASVPIFTDDRGFSRKHMFIEVTKGADGIIRHFAYNAYNKNETKVNGSLLVEGDKVILHSGDRIESSRTTLLFKI